MRKRLAAMVMAAVLAGSSMMGCAGSGNPASTAAGEPQETAPAAAGPDGSQEADPGCDIHTEFLARRDRRCPPADVRSCNLTFQ